MGAKKERLLDVALNGLDYFVESRSMLLVEEASTPRHGREHTVDVEVGAHLRRVLLLSDLDKALVNAEHRLGAEHARIHQIANESNLSIATIM